MKIPCYETKRSNKKLDSLDNFLSSSVGESSTISKESKRERVSFVILGVLATGSADDRITFLTGSFARQSRKKPENWMRRQGFEYSSIHWTKCIHDLFAYTYTALGYLCRNDKLLDSLLELLQFLLGQKQESQSWDSFTLTLKHGDLLIKSIWIH